MVVAELSAGGLKQTSQEDSGSEITSIITQDDFESNEALDLQELADTVTVTSVPLAAHDDLQLEESES